MSPAAENPSRGFRVVREARMDLAARRAQAHRNLRRAFWAWTILASTAATIGGFIGWVSFENDDWPS